MEEDFDEVKYMIDQLHDALAELKEDLRNFDETIELETAASDAAYEDACKVIVAAGHVSNIWEHLQFDGEHYDGLGEDIAAAREKATRVIASWAPVAFGRPTPTW